MKNTQPGHRARKRFGQNFLHDPMVISNIVRHIHPEPGQLLVEIGPGMGALTEQILPSCDGKLHVIELDKDLVPVLRTKFFNYPGLTIHEGDALKFPFDSLVTDQRKLRLVGNLPYNISTPLIFHLLSYADKVQDMHFMLQKEVVERMAAQAGEKAYGRLSIMVQYYCRVTPLFVVPPGAFRPRPKVDSAIVRLSPHTQKPVVAQSVKALEQVVRTAFNMRRKTLRNALASLLSEEAVVAAGVDPSARPETLSIGEFVALADKLAETGGAGGNC